MERKKIKFNIIDLLAAAMLLAAACLVGWKLTHRGAVQQEMVKVTFQVTAEGVPNELYEHCQAHLPSPLMASGALVGGEIVSVEKRPYLELSSGGQWVEDPEHVTRVFTAVTETPAADVMTTKVGEQEVRIGKTDYILKSEYIEFSKVTVTDVKWGE